MIKKILLLVFLFPNILSAQNIDSLKTIAYGKASDSVKIDALHKLGVSFLNSDLKKTLRFNKECYALSRKSKLDFGLAKSYNLRGIIHDINGNIDSSYYCYYKAQYHVKKVKLPITEASINNNLGLLDYNSGKYTNAINYYIKALKIFEKIDDKEGQANALSNISLVYERLHDFKNSYNYIMQSLKIRKEIKDDYGVSVCYVNLGNLYENQLDRNKSIENYKKAIAIKRKIDDQNGLSTVNNNLASVLIKDKNYAEALQCLNESVAIAKKLDSKTNLIYAYSGFTDYFIKTNNLKKAKEFNALTFSIATELNEAISKLNCIKYYEKIALLEKDFEKAYTYSKAKDSIQANLNSLDVQKAITEIETKYEVEKKEKELLLSKVEIAKNELQIKKKNTQFQILALILIALITIGYLIYRQQKLKNKQREQEFELKSAIKEIETQNQLQEQRLSISRDLHDNIGAQLTFVISSVDNLKFGNQINDAKIENQLTKISDFTKSTIIELRDTIWAMNNNEFSFEDLRSRIFNFIEKAKIAKENIQFEFNIDENLVSIKLSSLVGINIYRTIQEALNNAIKYSESSKISVDVKSFQDKIQINIQDNGKGFDIENVDFGNGLNNMKKRIEEIDGEFEVNSIVGKGTVININIDK
ncbi:sensor histidine kinase [Flavobacterium sp.]|uniref:tetratricopeptide repeat-containing sensor histidine kinase n=1 Tax=Flavobacterium sp. TaxID=239 RepID=UPI00261B2DE5|nr:sensor histidine kinase [Flavobacterium sp.]